MQRRVYREIAHPSRHHSLGTREKPWRAADRAGTRREALKASLALPRAVCVLGPNGRRCDGRRDRQCCRGKVWFIQAEPRRCRISWDVQGCGAAGPHGMHIHEKADFSRGCQSAGPHYNPRRKRHGGPDDRERHVGDLGNVEVDADGRAEGRMVDRLVRVKDVVGRSVILHEEEDDLGRGGDEESLRTGNAGARIACGRIDSVNGAAAVKRRLNLLRVLHRNRRTCRAFEADMRWMDKTYGLGETNPVC